MADFQVTKTIQGGSSELLTEQSFETTGKLSIIVDNEFVFDDIIVDLGSSEVDYNVSLIYPSGTKLMIKSDISTDFILNTASSSRNMWYRVPAWTRLEIEVLTVSTSGKVKVSAIGRG